MVGCLRLVGTTCISQLFENLNKNAYLLNLRLKLRSWGHLEMQSPTYLEPSNKR